MRKYFYYTLFLTFLFLLGTACNKKDDDYCEPDEICYTQKPDSLYVKLELSNNPSSTPREVSFYKGHLDDGELLEKFNTSFDTEYLLMPVGERYTATAKYLKDSDTILVIDSEKLKSESYKNCDETCYD